MKVKHVVEATIEEVDKLFDGCSAVCLADYTSIESMNEAILLSKLKFSECLNKYLCEAFKIGENIGIAASDEKDTEMYKIK